MKGFSLERYLKDLEHIVNIDSGSWDIEGITQVAKFFAEKFEDLGMDVKVHDLEEVGPCLEIRNHPEDDNIDILFTGHMDTVFPKGTVSEWSFSQEGNRAYGPGVIDMKSGLLTIYEIMRLMDSDLRDSINFCIIMNPDEEISSRKSKEIISERAKTSKYAFIMEPARVDGSLVKERKGLAQYTIDFTGKVAHAGVDPENGRSAILALARFILEMDKLVDYDKGISLNPGIIEGGTVANTVAEHATVKLDLRYVEGDQIDVVEDELKRLVEMEKGNDIVVDITRTGHRPPMNPSEKSLELVDLYSRVGESLGLKLNWVKTGGGSDGNFAAFEGAATIDALGPVGGKAHSKGEYLEIDTIEPRLELLMNVIKAMKEESLI